MVWKENRERSYSIRLFAVTAMLVTYALESRSSWFILAFAAFLRPRLCLQISARRVDLRRGGSDLVGRGRGPLVSGATFFPMGVQNYFVA